MLDIIGITFPVFGLIAVGYFTVWLGMFSADDLKVFGRYVLNIALPALLFMVLSRNPLSEIVHGEYLMVYGGAALVTMGLTYLWFTLRPTGPALRAIAVMGASCPNSGYLGLPILMLALPEIADSAIAMNLFVENLVMVPISLVLLDLSCQREGQSIPKLLAQTFKNIAKRPLVIGMALGILASAVNFQMPVPFERLIGLVAASLAPIALFVIGGSLVGLPMRGNFPIALQITFAKLIVQPLVVAAIIAGLITLGSMSLSTEMQSALIISSAMPMIGIYAILAQEYGHEGMASIALLASVTLGFFTASALLYILL